MTSLWASTIASLDDAVALLSESVEKLEAARPADLAEMLNQFQMASDSSRMLRELVSSQLPEASWQNRAELERLIAQEMQKNSENAIDGIFAVEAGAMPTQRI
jgi:hypothetical protein